MQKGDEVLTNGGIAGRITKVDETYIGLEIAENVEISVQKNAVTASCPRAP
jgi:preprotein translocase subunit YajC